LKLHTRLFIGLVAGAALGAALHSAYVPWVVAF
jgi:hypothetical protein